MNYITAILLIAIAFSKVAATENVGETSVESLPNVLVRSIPNKCTLFDGKKKYVGCKHAKIKLGFGAHIGKVTGTLEIKFGKVILMLSATPGATIFKFGVSSFLVGKIPPFPKHKDVKKFCHGTMHVMAMKDLMKLPVPKGKKNCCKSFVYVTGKITVCDKKMDLCKTKQFFKAVKIICINVCAGQGKNKKPGPMSASVMCPTCK